MPSLLETQRAFRDALYGGDESHLQRLFDHPGAELKERLAIYRDTVSSALIRALRLSHPAVLRLVGPEFFEAAARGYIEANRPTAPSLDHFGSTFSRFLGTFPGSSRLPYLQDVGRLDWCVHEALHARDCQPIDLQLLARVAGTDVHGRCRFMANPSLHLITAPTPVDAIWRAVLEENDESLRGLDLEAGAVWLAVRRLRDGDLEVERLSRETWTLAAALLDGRTWKEALDAALDAAIDTQSPDKSEFDAGATLRHLLVGDFFTDFRIESDLDSRTALGNPTT